MKTIILYTSAFIFLVSACKAEPMSKELSEQTQVRAREIIKLAKDQKTEELIKNIRPAEESGVKRHAATADKVTKIFGSVDLSKIEFGASSYDKVREVFVIQITSPIRIDLEFSIDSKTGKPAKLQALHP